MQIKVQNRKLQDFLKICSKFFFLTLFSIIFVFEAKNTCFLLIPVKFVAVLQKIKFWKIQDGGQNGGHVMKTAVAMATVLN